MRLIAVSGQRYMVGLAGASAAGKTTWCQIIAALYPVIYGEQCGTLSMDAYHRTNAELDALSLRKYKVVMMDDKVLSTNHSLLNCGLTSCRDPRRHSIPENSAGIFIALSSIGRPPCHCPSMIGMHTSQLPMPSPWRQRSASCLSTDCTVGCISG